MNSMKSPALPKRRLGRTSAELSIFGFGGATLGENYAPIPEDVSRETLDSAWTSGCRYYDTSPWYGHGLSELRLGADLRYRPRDSFVLSTKVGRTFFRPIANPTTYRSPFWAGGLPFDFRFDYTYDGIMRSYESSLFRLGLNTVDLLLIHDLDAAEIGSEQVVEHHFIDLEKSGYRALEGLRSSGEIKGIGAGVNLRGTMKQFLSRFDLDFFLVAMPYTLLDQGVLEDEFPMCEERGVGVVVGSPFASGILASGSQAEKAYYNYLPADLDVRTRTARIEAVCLRHSVSLKAAAIQFPLLHPIVASVVSGAATAEQAAENTGLLMEEIPPAFWEELVTEELLRKDSLRLSSPRDTNV